MILVLDESRTALSELPKSPLPSTQVRIVLSVLVVLHLLAVLGEPMRMFTQGRQPSAPDAGLVRGTLGPYIDFVYLHHGYFFFAPNPGPSHLMDITLIDADGGRRHLRLPIIKPNAATALSSPLYAVGVFVSALCSPGDTSARWQDYPRA